MVCGAASSLGSWGDGSTMSLGHRALGGAHDPCPPSGTIRPQCPGGGGGGGLWSRSQQAHLRALLSLGNTMFMAQ